MPAEYPLLRPAGSSSGVQVKLLALRRHALELGRTTSWWSRRTRLTPRLHPCPERGKLCRPDKVEVQLRQGDPYLMLV